MEPPAAGSVVLVSFPFSDLSRAKLRPTLVLASVGREDFLLCQITSNPYADPHAVELTNASFAEGSLHRVSYARPGKLFTAHTSLMEKRVGAVRIDVLQKVVSRVISILRAP